MIFEQRFFADAPANGIGREEAPLMRTGLEPVRAVPAEGIFREIPAFVIIVHPADIAPGCHFRDAIGVGVTLLSRPGQTSKEIVHGYGHISLSEYIVAFKMAF